MDRYIGPKNKNITDRMISRIKATRIGSSAWKIVHKKFRGQVHSVFDRVFNISLEEGLFGVADEEVRPSPINLITSLPRSEGIESLGIDEGMAVFGNGKEIIIENGLEISLKDAKKWTSKTKTKNPLDMENIRQNLNFSKKLVSEDFIRKQGAIQLTESISEIFEGTSKINDSANELSKKLMPRISGLLKGIKERNHGKIQKNSEKIIGLGPGLTPSGDDVLAGFMIARYWIANTLDKNLKRIMEENKAIVRTTHGTTPLSRQLLRNASFGEGNEIVATFLESLLSGTKKGVKNNLEEIEKIGESSGLDTLIGIFIGIEFSLDELFDS